MGNTLIDPKLARRQKLSTRARTLYGAAWVLGHGVFRYAHITPRMIKRAQRLDRLAARRPRPKHAIVDPVRLDGFNAEWVRSRHATADADQGTVLYFHGGGFFSCGLNTHRHAVAAISSVTELPALSVNYRQLPDTPISGSIADCVTSYRHLLDDIGVPAGRIVFAGDSAGGFLTFATALRARDEGLPMPAGVAALSPLTDLDSTARMHHPNVRKETYIPVNLLGEATDFWSDGVTTSPVDADLTGMPPSLIMVGETEILLSDAERMANRLWAAGAQCKLQVWRRQVHAFPVLVGAVPESRIALDQAGRFVREAIKDD